MRYHQAVHDVPVLFEACERAAAGAAPDPSVRGAIPAELLRAELNLPDLPERDVVKHFINLSQMNFGVDNGLYPLGSCTMKFNPKVCDEVVGLPTVADIHPLQDPSTAQGALRLMFELEQMLCEVAGMDAVTLQPAAGAHGEWTGIQIARAYHESRGETRKEVVLPDTAHGTN
ncbi:MAG: aminomethyl-transferring glycine dehydrogenase subunit GcvPB, partial [Thermoplasmata archaeon]|nr:aminomethyl-transferring glycine dehydrogenase subunit GcvPB [Thermoplasmata archaeon]